MGFTIEFRVRSIFPELNVWPNVHLSEMVCRAHDATQTQGQGHS